MPGTVATHEMSVKLNSENGIIIITSSFSQNVLLDKVDTLSAETLNIYIFIYKYIYLYYKYNIYIYLFKYIYIFNLLSSSSLGCNTL